MSVDDGHVFPGFLTKALTQLSFQKPPTALLTGERRKYAGKKSRHNRGSNSHPPGHESDMLNTDPPGRGKIKCSSRTTLNICFFHGYWHDLIAFEIVSLIHPRHCQYTFKHNQIHYVPLLITMLFLSLFLAHLSTPCSRGAFFF